MVRRRNNKRYVGILVTGVALTFSLYFFLFSPVSTPTNLVRNGRRLVGTGESFEVKPLVEDSAITTSSTVQNDLFWLPSFNSSFDVDKCRLALKLFDLLSKEAAKLPRGENYVNCENVFEAVRYCNKFSGLKPLPNFYLRRKQGFDNITEEDYLRAHLGFIHVPKAGGTSVETFLLEYTTRPVVNESVSPFRLAHCKDFLNAVTHLKHEPTSQVKRRKPTSNPIVFYSKRPFGIHYYLPTNRTFMYATWFREPISRFLSTFYYQKAKRWGGQPLTHQYVFRSKSLTDFLEKTRNAQIPEYDNYMVRLLQFGNFPELDAHFEDCCGASSPATVKVEEKHYLLAKKNLQLMAFIGLTEDFKVSQDMFMNIFGKKPEGEVIHVNSNPHSINITDFERSEIERKVFWDIKLYQDAKEIFEEQKKGYLQSRLSKVLEVLH